MSWKRYSVPFIRYRIPTSSVPEQPAVLVIQWWYWITSDFGGPTNQLIFLEWWPFWDGENVTDVTLSLEGEWWPPTTTRGSKKVTAWIITWWTKHWQNPPNGISYRSLNWCFGHPSKIRGLHQAALLDGELAEGMKFQTCEFVGQVGERLSLL